MNEYKIAHLEMIQGVINRMGNNSFIIKGWAVTLVSGLFAVSIENYKIAFISLVPIFLFWWLDTFFLYQERLFRELYKDIILKDDSNFKFSMEVSGYYSNIDSFCKTLFSKTLCYFYGSILLIAIIFIIYLNPIFAHINIFFLDNFYLCIKTN